MSNTPVSRSERIIDQVLAEAGLEDADDLRPVLLELRALTGESPQPNPQVQALMSGTSGALTHRAAEPAGDPGSTVVDLDARRRNKRRLPLAALGVAVALAAGGGAAAADQGVRDTLHDAFSSIAATFGSNQGQQRPDRDARDAGQPGGTSQGTPPSPALSTPPTTPGSSPSGGPGKDQVQPPGPAEAGNGRSPGSEWLGKNTPSVPGTGHTTPSELPAPEVTAPGLELPSVPALPSPERSEGPKPQP